MENLLSHIRNDLERWFSAYEFVFQSPSKINLIQLVSKKLIMP